MTFVPPPASRAMFCAHCQDKPSNGHLVVVWDDTLERVSPQEMDGYPPFIPMCRTCGWNLDGQEAGRDSESHRRGVYRYNDPNIAPPPPRYTIKGAVHRAGSGEATETLCGLSLIGRRVLWAGETVPAAHAHLACPLCAHENAKLEEASKAEERA